MGGLNRRRGCTEENTASFVRKVSTRDLKTSPGAASTLAASGSEAVLASVGETFSISTDNNTTTATARREQKRGQRKPCILKV